MHALVPFAVHDIHARCHVNHLLDAVIFQSCMSMNVEFVDENFMRVTSAQSPARLHASTALCQTK